MTLSLTLVQGTYIVAGLLAHPDWKAAALATFRPPSTEGIRNYGYLFMLIGLVGSTIAPWMQFYLQSSIVEKGITARQYATSRWDVILGCLFTDVVAWFIIVACAATLYANGSTAEKQGVIEVLGNLKSPESRQVLQGYVDQLNAGTLPSELQVDLLEAVQTDGSEGLAKGLETYRTAKKADTLVQAFAIGFYLLPLPELLGADTAGAWVAVWVRGILLAAALALTVVTGVDYVLRAMRLRASAPARPGVASDRPRPP